MSELYPVDQALPVLLEKAIDRASALESVTASGLSADKIVMGAMELHRMFKSEADAIAAEVERITAILNCYTAKAELCKHLVNDYMLAEDIDELTIGTRTAAMQLNNPAVVVDDEAAIPPKFFVTTQTTKLDKKAVAEAIKQGSEIPGAHLERTKSVRFK